VQSTKRETYNGGRKRQQNDDIIGRKTGGDGQECIGKYRNMQFYQLATTEIIAILFKLSI
jgi:hypothetical protein